MAQRKSLIIAATLTSFILVILIALTTQLTRPVPAAASTPLADTTTQQTASLDPTVQAQITQLKATYQQQLDAATLQLQQANAQLTQAYSKEQALTTQLAQVQQAFTAAQATNSAQAASVSSQYAVSAAQAAQTALTSSPQSQLIGNPQLVSYHGSTAYEVVLDQGNIYVDANSGAVLYNGTTAAASTGSVSGSN
ncbi:MAG: hypothetical protein DLM69_09235 [Candidatus Chloroheliales bacterium]|nr:MAG: hypothetical protein DLM69_09235 [Chloroflexota bacterium]